MNAMGVNFTGASQKGLGKKFGDLDYRHKKRQLHF
jgi:hypothetical protein